MSLYATSGQLRSYDSLGRYTKKYKVSLRSVRAADSKLYIAVSQPISVMYHVKMKSMLSHDLI